MVRETSECSTPRAGRRACVIAPSAFALVLLIGLIGPAAGLSAPDEAESTGPTTDDFAEILADTPDDQQGDVAPTPAELADSETEFANLADAAALDVVQQSFEDLLSAQLIPELDLPADQQVAKYTGPYTARITTDGSDPNLLVESIGLPLRAPEGGEQEPLDGELVDQGDHLEADNAPVEAEISTESAEGFEIPAAGVSVAPVQAGPAVADEVSDKAFFANAGTDTDYLLAPAATGVEQMLQLRSEDSPEAFAFDVEMPAGATLESSADGGARVSKDGEAILAVSPPSAYDAAGAAVSVSYAISGDRLTIEVPHRAGSYLYPIMVDPLWAVTDQYNWGAGQQNPNLDYWYSWSTHPNDFSSFFHVNEGGVMNRALGGRTFVNGSYAHWVATSIRSSYIERVDFFNFDRSPTSPGACTTLGIWNNGAWGYGTLFNPADQSYQYWQPYANLCNNAAHETRHFWVGMSSTPDGDNTGDYEAATGSSGIFALTSSGGTRSANAENLLRSAYVYRWDKNNPTITSSTPSSAWTNQPVWFQVSDSGLGASGVWVWEGWNIVGTGSAGCSGAHQDVCPTSAWVSVDDLPEGRHNLTAVGIDPVVNGSNGQSWTARVDRTGPQLSLGGSLKAYENRPVPSGGYSLQINATDGVSGGSAVNERSGVAEYWVFVDGTQVAHENPGCATNSCSLSRSWIYDTAAFPDAPHVVSTVVKDAAGNVSNDCFGVDRSTPQAQETTFRLRNRLPLSQITSVLTATSAQLTQLRHEGLSTGDQEFYAGSLASQLDDYRSSYLTLHGVEPEIREITMWGRVDSSTLGALAAEITSRTINCPDAADPDLADQSEEDFPDLGPDDPDYERSTYPTEQFAPFKGHVITNDVVRLDGTTRRRIHHTFRFSQNALNEFDVSGLDHAYEHDLDLFHTPGSEKCDENGDFNQGAYWAERKKAVFWDTNIPESAHPRLDIVVGDNCEFGQQDFTLWVEYPGQLEADHVYTATFYAKKGLRSSGRYKLNGWSLDRDCNFPGGGALDMACTDAPLFGTGARGQLLIAKDKGLAPECRRWRKGEPSRFC